MWRDISGDVEVEDKGICRARFVWHVGRIIGYVEDGEAVNFKPLHQAGMDDSGGLVVFSWKTRDEWDAIELMLALKKR